VKERDLLIAQTMAFVQSVTGKKPEAEVRVEPGPADEFEPVEPTIAAAETPRRSAMARSELREEVEGRVAAFRAHQQRFDRERDRHFTSVLGGIRAAIADRTKAPPS
jgi:Cu/Ag efflux pump CusA